MRQQRQGGFRSDQGFQSAQNKHEGLQSKELENLEINSLQSGSEFQANPASSEQSFENEQTRPILATPEKTQCYKRFDNYPVRIEGPEFQNDYTYYLIDKQPDLTTLERGIPLPSFNDKITDEWSISNSYQGEKGTTNGKSPSTNTSSLATKSQNLQGKVNLIAPIAVTEELDADDCETENEANEGKLIN